MHFLKIYFGCITYPECNPPNTPPMHIGASSPLQMIRSLALSFLSFSSREVKMVPSGKIFYNNLFACYRICIKCMQWLAGFM
jgi:hypothetical protein